MMGEQTGMGPQLNAWRAAMMQRSTAPSSHTAQGQIGQLLLVGVEREIERPGRGAELENLRQVTSAVCEDGEHLSSASGVEKRYDPVLHPSPSGMPAR